MNRTALSLAVLLACGPGAAGPVLPGGGVGLLIVAPRRFEKAVQGYAAFKKERRPVEVAVLEDVIAKAPGTDDPERLKHLLFDAWKSRGIGFVLLVGDADVLPVRYMCLDRVTPAAFDYAFYPSDLYYADLAKSDGSFEDWNGNKDGFHKQYFGEVRGEKNKSDPMNYDGIDYHPDVAVGRWPVSTGAELAVVIAKSKAYEERRTTLENAKTGIAEAGLKDRVALVQGALAVMVGGWVDARAQMDSIVSTLPKGWDTTKLYYKDGNDACATEPPDESHIVGALNRGVGLVMHAGHGADDRWEAASRSPRSRS
jgi:hypothetical protein